MNATPTVDVLFGRVAASYPQLSPAFQNVARYLEGARSRLLLDKAGDVAQCCNVSISTVVRFAQRFGFSGYRSLREAFREVGMPPVEERAKNRRDRAGRSSSWRDKMFDDTRTALEGLGTTADPVAVEMAINLLANASHVHVMGSRHAGALAIYCVYAVQSLEKPATLVEESARTGSVKRAYIRPTEVLLAVGVGQQPAWIRHKLEEANSQGVQVVAIADAEYGKFMSERAVVIAVPTSRGFDINSFAVAMCLCQALLNGVAYLLDSKFHETEILGDYDD